MSKDFFSLLFNSDEQTCFSPDAYGTALVPVATPSTSAVYFSINPLHTDRRDSNVLSYRNILVEMDKVPLDEQLQLIKELEVPYSAITYSGGKSYHVIISLAEPCASRADYDQLVNRVYRKIGLDKVDKSCRNPSRFSRVPNVVRPDTGKVQSLEKLYYRIPRSELESWLPADIPKLPPTINSKFKPSPNGYTLAFIKNGAAPGEWNPKLFAAACDLTRCGYSADEIVHKLSKPTGYLDRTDLRTIESAITTASKDLIDSNSK
jgi:hypothetical protein